MRVAIARSPSLPRQAWLIRVEDGGLDALVGSNVRITDHGFYEGGFASTEGPEALRLAGVHLGSGAVWQSDRVTLIAPSHTLESVWTAEVPGAVLASNSLAFLVAAIRPASLNIWRLRNAIRTIHDGVSRYRREIFRERDLLIGRYANAFVTVEAGRPPAERQQRQEAAFDSFGSYVDFLMRTVAEAVASFGGAMSVYLSRGYDSPAVAALASRLGPVTAISMDRTATNGDDDGAVIAEALGIPVVRAARKLRETRIMSGEGWMMPLEVIAPEDYEDVFEFFCGVHVSEECMRAPDGAVSGRAVLTGWAGDAIWSLAGEPWRDFVRPIHGSGGIGLGEFRLRTGFMHLPVPALAFNRAEAVRAIGMSEAMAPWRLGTAYDRPIPRRIAEEAGVPREMFGRTKRYTATKAANLHAIAGVLFEMQLARYAPALEAWPFTPTPETAEA